MGFTSFSAAVVFFKTRLYCPYLRSLCFNFCDELGERKMWSAFLQDCKAIQRCQVFVRCHVWGRTWTSVSEQRHVPSEWKAAALWADSWSTWEFSWEWGTGGQERTCRGSGEPAHRSAPFCHPTSYHSISLVDRGMLLLRVWTAKRQSDFVLWGSKKWVSHCQVTKMKELILMLFLHCSVKGLLLLTNSC